MARTIETVNLNDREDEERWFNIGVLFAEMKKAGCWYERRYMYTLEDKGLLTLPRVGTYRGLGARKLKKKHIRAIIAAFSPGGKGEWHYAE